MSKLLLEEIEKNIFDGGLHDLIEITYAYDLREDGTFFNRTLFSTFTNITDCKSYQDVYELVMRRLEHYYQQVELYQEQIAHTRTYSFKHHIVERYLQYVLDALQVVMMGVPFEIEKAGFSLPVGLKDIERRTVTMEGLEAPLFGKMVREEVFEVSRGAHLLDTLLSKNKHLLSAAERKEMIGFLDVLRELPTFREAIYDEPDETIWIMDEDPLFQESIEREHYVHIFELALQFYEIQKPVIVDARSSIYDAPEALYIPNDFAYDTLKIQRVLQLLAHEVETHYLIQENNSVVLGDLKGAQNLMREEGLAKINEETLNGATIENFDIGYGIPQIALGEILPGKEFRRFVEIYGKLNGSYLKTTNQFLRRKRNYSLTHRGVQHKDVTYSRGRFQVRAYLMNGGDYASLYYGKVDMDDMKLLHENMTATQKKQMRYPQFLAERLLYELQGNKYTFERFKTHLMKKYPFIDFRVYKFKEYTKEQERIVEEMVEVFTGV